MKTIRYHFPTMRLRLKLIGRAIQCLWTGRIEISTGPKNTVEPHTGGPETYTRKVYTSRPMTAEESKAVDAAFEDVDKAFGFVDAAFGKLENLSVKGHRRVMPRPSLFRGKQ